jgi:hypothetical protein
MNAPIDTIIDLRASRLPLAFHCAASIRASQVRINASNEQAGTGTATHKVLEPLVETGTIDWSSIDRIADEFDGDAQEVRMLVGKACRLWAKIRDSFPRALTEIAVDRVLEIAGLRITGHIDLISISGDVARILDWKSGRLDSDYWQQLRAYGCMVLLQFPQLRECTVAAAWIRTEEIENYTLTQADAEKWLHDLTSKVVNWDGKYRPGTKHCEHCPRNHECPAVSALVRRDVTAIAGLDADNMERQLATMPAADVIELVRRAKSVQNYAERAIDAVREHVKRGNAIESNGVALTIQTESRRELDPQLTWKVLEKDFGFTDEDFAAVVKLGAMKIEKRVAQNAGKGNGAAAVRDLKLKLELAGAVENNEIQKLTERRTAWQQQ